MPGFGEALQFMSFSSYPYKATLLIRLKFLLISCSFRNKRLKQQLNRPNIVDRIRIFNLTVIVLRHEYKIKSLEYFKQKLLAYRCSPSLQPVLTLQWQCKSLWMLPRLNWQLSITDRVGIKACLRFAFGTYHFFLFYVRLLINLKKTKKKRFYKLLW